MSVSRVVRISCEKNDREMCLSFAPLTVMMMICIVDNTERRRKAVRKFYSFLSLFSLLFASLRFCVFCKMRKKKKGRKSNDWWWCGCWRFSFWFACGFIFASSFRGIKSKIRFVRNCNFLLSFRIFILKFCSCVNCIQFYVKWCRKIAIASRSFSTNVCMRVWASECKTIFSISFSASKITIFFHALSFSLHRLIEKSANGRKMQVCTWTKRINFERKTKKTKITHRKIKVSKVCRNVLEHVQTKMLWFLVRCCDFIFYSSLVPSSDQSKYGLLINESEKFFFFLWLSVEL